MLKIDIFTLFLHENTRDERNSRRENQEPPQK